MRNLTTFEKDELLRFFLHYMKQDQRHLLMATYPIHYRMLFPSIDKETLSFKVAERIQWMEENSVNALPNRTSPVL